MMCSCVIPLMRRGSFYLQTVNLQTTGVRKKPFSGLLAFVLHPRWSKPKTAASDVIGSSKTAVRGVEGEQLCLLLS